MEYKGKKIYEDPPEAADGYRSDYAQGIRDYIAAGDPEIRPVFTFLTAGRLTGGPETLPGPITSVTGTASTIRTTAPLISII